MTPKPVGPRWAAVSVAASLLWATASRPVALAAQADSAQDPIAAIKQSMAASQQLLRQYEWIETTTLSLSGEQKSQTQNRCYYGADGVLQKVPVAAPAADKGKRGVRGKVIASKKEELADYLKNAVALVKTYVPPDPAKLEAVKKAGKTSVDLLDPGKRVGVNFRDYAKPGDKLGLELDVANNRLLGLTVGTYMADPKDAVKLDARFALLDDGATYPKQITLDAPAKQLKVVVENSGYRKASQ
jgi:hypothetical protein